MPAKATDDDKSTPSSGQSVRRFRHRTEFAREKEVFRHLQPWLETYNPVKRDVFSGKDVESVSGPEKCPDVALAAFAQLVAVRLNARRCLVTLISSSLEIVLADVAQTMSLQYNTAEDSKDKLWIGTSSFPRTEGINLEAISEWRKARRPRSTPDEDDYYYHTPGASTHHLLISDVRESKQMEDREFVQHGDWIRFCCSVPLEAPRDP